MDVDKDRTTNQSSNSIEELQIDKISRKIEGLFGNSISYFAFNDGIREGQMTFIFWD